MIRRWSCVNSLSVTNHSFNKFKKAFKINIFKSSVNYKRFTFKVTKFKRKTIARWKHRSNWFAYLNLFKYWTLDYKFNKQLFKFQYFNNLFSNTFFIFDANYIQKKTLPLLNNPYNFNLLSISKKIFFWKIII